MASKVKCSSVSTSFMLYMAAVACLSAGLVVLQHFCLNHRDGDFITSQCRLESHMGSIVAGILTLLTLAMAALIASTVEAYRSMKLASGITEGVYIAMGSTSYRYQLRALLTPWAPAMLIIILFTAGPNFIQFLANFGITTATVYVRNPSTANVYNASSYYNATVVTPPSDLSSAVGVLTKMRIYGTSLTSTVTDDGKAVSTSVIRDGYLGPLNTLHSDASNAFSRVETVATITSTCTPGSFMGRLSEAVPHNPAAVNLTLVLPALDLGAAVIYDVLSEVLTGNSLLLRSSLSIPFCQSGKCSGLEPDTQVSGRTATCTSTLVIQDQDIIYTVGADSVTPRKLVGDATTVSVSDLANLIVAFADSVEAAPEGVSSPAYVQGVLNMYSSFPPGSLEVSEANVLHTKLCASASLALKSLWASYINNGSAPAVELDGLQGSAYDMFMPVPLFNMEQLTYISTASVIIMAGVLTGAACIVGLVGMAFAVTSRINIKPLTDSSLLYNADAALIAAKQDPSKGLSNDPEAQLAHEFSPGTVLHCREFAYEHPAALDATKSDILCRVNITYNNSGTMPNKCDEYC